MNDIEALKKISNAFGETQRPEHFTNLMSFCAAVTWKPLAKQMSEILAGIQFAL